MRGRMGKLALAMVLVLALLCGSAMAASYSAKVLTSSMDVYGLSDGQRVRLGALDQGTSFTVTEISGDWARISYKGRTGYAKLEDMVFARKIAAVAVRDTTIRFVTRASYSQNIYYSATLAAGTAVYVVGVNDDLLLVTNASGSALGYVSASALNRS